MSINIKKQFSSILFLTIFALGLSQCAGTMFDQTSGSVNNDVLAEESVSTETAILKKIDANGDVKIIMSVESFVDANNTITDAAEFDILLNEEEVVSNEKALRNYFNHNEQIATAYESIEFTLSGMNLMDEDKISIVITSAAGGEPVTLMGQVFSTHDTLATQTVAEM